MRDIYCVSVDWADRGYEHNGVLACFDKLDDAVAYMNEQWNNEREQDYFEQYDQMDCNQLKKEAWVDGEWIDKHYCLEIDSTTLYSEVDVAKGLI